jgi:branched-chain amino acid transport system substrate-binding protein
MLQWQDGKQVNMWPKEFATGELKFPAFIQLPSH